MIPNSFARASTASRSSSPTMQRRRRHDEEAHREEDHAEIRRPFRGRQRILLAGTGESRTRRDFPLGGKRFSKRSAAASIVIPSGGFSATDVTAGSRIRRAPEPLDDVQRQKSLRRRAVLLPVGFVLRADPLRVHRERSIPVRDRRGVGHSLESGHQPLVQRRAFHRDDAAQHEGLPLREKVPLRVALASA